MSVSSTQSSVSSAPSGRDHPRDAVLTLAEAAAYLRVAEAAVEQLAVDEAIPARRVGGEWRFSKAALEDWLRFPGHSSRDSWLAHRPWLVGVPLADELIDLLEKRLLEKLKPAAQAPRPGSKQAVLGVFGALRDEGDLDEQLEAIRKRREAGG